MQLCYFSFPSLMARLLLMAGLPESCPSIVKQGKSSLTFNPHCGNLPLLQKIKCFVIRCTLHIANSCYCVFGHDFPSYPSRISSSYYPPVPVPALPWMSLSMLLISPFPELALALKSEVFTLFYVACNFGDLSLQLKFRLFGRDHLCFGIHCSSAGPMF